MQRAETPQHQTTSARRWRIASHSTAKPHEADGRQRGEGKRARRHGGEPVEVADRRGVVFFFWVAALQYQRGTAGEQKIPAQAHKNSATVNSCSRWPHSATATQARFKTPPMRTTGNVP